jgi:hypothetical protein
MPACATTNRDYEVAPLRSATKHASEYAGIIITLSCKHHGLLSLSYRWDKVQKKKSIGWGNDDGQCTHCPSSLRAAASNLSIGVYWWLQGGISTGSFKLQSRFIEFHFPPRLIVVWLNPSVYRKAIVCQCFVGCCLHLT